ncbi:MAG TPA: clan AA aspartic protease [Casimicrobiaceae bacterium]
MGIVYVDLRLSNPSEPGLEEITANALVDTGAIDLVIAEHVAIQLKLGELSPREMRLADGSRRKVRYAGPVKVEMQGRNCFTGAIIMGDRLLLGAIPMEQLDVVVDPRGLRVIPNPENPNVQGSLALAASRASVRDYGRSAPRQACVTRR